MNDEKVLIDGEEMRVIIERLTFQIAEKCRDMENAALVGIRRRGVYLAERIEDCLKKHGKRPLPNGTLDITLYRDDLSEISAMPEIRGSSVNFDINGKTLILVDDVLYTGRTVMAALDALRDYGRPRKILLAVMVDRGHRELPITADFTGKHIPTNRDEIVHVKVREIDGEDLVSISRREGTK